MTQRAYMVYFTGRDAAGTLTGFRYSTIGMHDTGLWADSRLQNPGVIDEQMFGGDRLRGEMDVQPVAIVLENLDGALDSLMDYSFDGETLSLYEVDPSTLVISRWMADITLEQPLFGEDSVTFAGRDYRHRFDVGLADIRYAGTNSGSPLAGIEGTAGDIKGAPKPMVIGKVFNVSPVLVNTTKLIYQVHKSRSANNPDAISGLSAGWAMTVYDKRAVLTAGADYADQAAMEATAPAAGQYRVWPAGGCFRLGSAPTGRITCDVTNPPQNSGTSYVWNVADRLNKHSVGSNPALYVYVLLHSNPEVGIFINDETTCLSAAGQIAASVNGFLFNGYTPDTATSTSVKPLLMQLTPPNSLPYTPHLASIKLDASTIVSGSLKKVAVPDETGGLPVWRVNVNYKRNYTVMGDADLAGVALADAEFCKREWRTVYAQDTGVQTKFPNAIEITVNTLLIDATAAQTEANRLLVMYGVERSMFSLTVPGEAIRLQSQFTAPGATVFPAMFQIGSIVNITHARFNLAAGRDFIAVGVRENLDTDMYELVLWG